MSRKRGFLIGLLASSPLLTAFSEPAQATGPLGLDWWAWVLILALALVVLASLVGWWLSQRPEKMAASTPPVKPSLPPVPKPPDVEPEPAADAAAVMAPPTSPPPPDDLKRIEGIGPKIAGLLADAGITTFAQLAAADVGQLKQILEQGGLGYLTNPTTWPEQARLAGAGDWTALEKLQDELKGGRRA